MLAVRTLPEFIRRHRSRIMDDWLAQAKELPRAHALTIDALRDHIPEFLDRLADAIERDDLTAVTMRGLPNVHAAMRGRDGYDLRHVVAEYRAIRSVILRLYQVAEKVTFVCTSIDDVELTGSSTRAVGRWCVASQGCRGQEAAHADDVVRGGGEGEDPADERTATVTQFPQAANGLHPAEYLFDQLAFALADLVSRVARGPRVDRAAAARRDVLRDVRRDIHPAQFGDDGRIVVPLVGAERDPAARPPFDHDEGGVAFAEAVGRRHACVD